MEGIVRPAGISALWLTTSLMAAGVKIDNFPKVKAWVHRSVQRPGKPSTPPWLARQAWSPCMCRVFAISSVTAKQVPVHNHQTGIIKAGREI